MLLLALLSLFSLANALPLLVERFDGQPDGWKERVASQTGGGPSSTVEVGNGVVTLTTAAKAKKFVSLGKRVELRGVTWLTVEAKQTMSSTDVATPASLCGAFVRFDTGLIVPVRACGARSDTETQPRYIPVPAAARDMEVGVVLDTPGTVTVDDVIVTGSAPEVKTVNRGSFTYHWTGNDSFRDADYEANETSYAQLASFLTLKPGVNVDYWKCADAAMLAAFTGRTGDFVAAQGSVHSLLRVDTRALLAALSTSWGSPPPLFFEGLAVHLQGDWDGRDPKLSSRMAVNEGTAPSLATLLDPAKFAAENPDRAHLEAGAFVSWIVATKGVEAVHSLFGATSNSATPAANQAAVEKVLGAPLAKVESDFRASL